MSRYADIDALMQSIRSRLGIASLDNLLESEKAIVKEIDSAPSIDIVRCGECKYCSKDRIKWSVKDEDGNWIDTKCNLCRRTKLEVNLDDFCSYGEILVKTVENHEKVTRKE